MSSLKSNFKYNLSIRYNFDFKKYFIPLLDLYNLKLISEKAYEFCSILFNKAYEYYSLIFDIISLKSRKKTNEKENCNST